MKHTFVVLILVALTSIPSIACEIEESLVNDAVATVQSEISVPIQTAVAEVNLTPIQSPEMADTTTADESTPEPVDDESTPEPVEDESTPEPVEGDLVSMIDPDSWGAPGGLGSGGSFGGVNQGDCVDLLVEYLEIGEQKGSELGVRQIMDLVASYTESQEGQIDCSDPAQLWDDIQDWLIKKLHIKLPTAKIIAAGVYPVRERDTFVWNEEITLRYPTLHLSEIYAYDIDDSVEPAIGVPWLFDRVEYSWKNCDADSWSNRQSTVYGFSYRADILESEYSEDHRLLCIDVVSETFGVHLDGSPAAESIRASERIKLRPYEDREDRFVVIGLGDSYGSGEGNSAKTLTEAEWEYIEDGTFWWDADSWPEEIITYTSHADSCHRSSESGLGKAVQKLARDFQGQLTYGHFACSGAVAGDLWLNSYTPDFYDGSPTMDPQILQALDWLSEINTSPAEVDAIVVSVGGNDVHFSDVIYDCFIEAGDCYDETDTLGYRSSINSKIPRAVSHISHVAGTVFPNAEIFFTSYTDGISVDPASNYDEDSDGVCSYDDDPWLTNVPYDDDEFWDIRAVDSSFVKGFMERINDSLDISVSEVNQNGSMWNEYWPFSHLGRGAQNALAEQIVDMYPPLRGREWRENGLNVFGRVHLIDSQFSDFRNNGFCTRDRRNIMFNSEAGDRQGYDQFRFWSSGGWHPNDFGYKLYGDAIAEALIEAFPQDYQNLRARR